MKKVLVTGSGGGMGKAICRLLVQKGYEVYGIDCKDSSADGLRSITCDVTDMLDKEKIVHGSVRSFFFGNRFPFY